ncbi:hypothetical protein Bbelb_115910 [Branchiostoma belcheri]|nr:hypothetical protein Bbelb_115910 [Branchiostoma belcheri]
MVDFNKLYSSVMYKEDASEAIACRQHSPVATYNICDVTLYLYVAVGRQPTQHVRELPFYHTKTMTVACLKQEIQSQEGRLQYPKALLGGVKSQIKWPAYFFKRINVLVDDDPSLSVAEALHMKLETVTRLLRPFLTEENLKKVSTRAEPEGSVASSARPFEEIPGPKGLPLIGTALDYSPFGQFPMKTKLMESFKERTKTYGNIYREKIGPMDLVVISDPKEIERVFRNEGRYPERQPLLSVKIYRELKKLPAGIVNLVGGEWQRVRSSVQKDLMRPKTVGAYAALQDDVTRDLVDVIRALTGKEENGGQIHNFTNYVYRWALEAISVVVLDKRLGCLTLDDLEPGSDAQLMIDGVNNFFKAFVKLELAAVGFYRYISTPTWRRFEKAINQWHNVAAKLLKEKLARSTTEEGKPAESDTDFLQSLLSREDVTFEEAMLMAVDLLAAGIDTTGNTLMFNLFCLAKNPEVQEKLYREIAEVVPPGQSIDDKTLNRMHYLRAVVKETFRVYPTVGNNLRTMDRDIVLSGYVVPAKGTRAMACQDPNRGPLDSSCGVVWCSGTSLDYETGRSWFDSWPYPNKSKHAPRRCTLGKEPEKFKPERWLRNDVASGGIPPFAMLPFGYGKRMCIETGGDTSYLARMTRYYSHVSLTSRSKSRRVHSVNKVNGVNQKFGIVQSFHVGWSGKDMKMENRFVNAPDRDSFIFQERV